jgi:thioredoxin reductase
MKVDVAVIGGGPAGLAAALWVARYRRSVVVLDSGAYRAARVERSHGYLGRDPQQPMELLAEGRRELSAYSSASVERIEVEAVDLVEGGFLAGRVTAKRLILASGVRDVIPDVAGMQEHYGSSAFHCPSCDGYEARDRDVVALGWDEHMVSFADSLLNWARSVTVVTLGHRFAGDEDSRADLRDRGVELIEDEVTELVGERGDLRAVALGSGVKLPASLLFFSIAHEPRTQLATALGCDLDDSGYIRVNSCGETTIKGVYAAGDVTPGLQLVAVAAASGVVAGVAAAQSLA